jgi:hypothetical protein
LHVLRLIAGFANDGVLATLHPNAETGGLLQRVLTLPGVSGCSIAGKHVFS